MCPGRAHARDASRTAALVAVASGSDAVGPIVAALGILGIEPVALAEAERAGFLRVSAGRVAVRPSATRLYERAAMDDRHAIHRALADALTGDSDRRLWHLAAATELPDETLAEALEAAATRAADRAHAWRLLERAAHLSRNERDRARRLLDAAQSARVAGVEDRATSLLDEALAGGPDPVLRARIQHERGRLRLHGQPEGLRSFLVAEAELVEALEPGLAARMLADGAVAAATSEVDLARATIARAMALARGIPNIEPFVELAQATIVARAGDAADAEPLLRRVLADHPGDRNDLAEAMLRAGTIPLWREDYRAARRVFLALVESARSVGPRAILPVAMDTLAAIDARTGHWQRAQRSSSAALRLALELGQTWQAASCHTTLARIAAARGDEPACRRHLAEAHDLGPEDTLLIAYARTAEALLALGQGAFDEAARILEFLDATLRDAGFATQGVVAYLPDLVEAHARARRWGPAAAALVQLEAQVNAEALGTTAAAAARCAGLLADAKTFARHFETALRAHDLAETPFERARTELCYGERLRRAGRRSDARLHLERAAATFERLGATPWAQRARQELGRDATTRDSMVTLTAHERQVVALVVAGATNAEAARALYVSPKTVEHHLGSVYRKLELRSRTQLVRRWLETEGPS